MKNYCEWRHQADDWSCPKLKITPKDKTQFQCPKCSRDIVMMTVPRAVEVIGVSKVTLYDWMRNGWISWEEYGANRRLICYSSMFTPQRQKTEEEKYVDALSERAKGSGLRVCRKEAA